MSTYYTWPGPDGIPVLHVVSSGTPGEAGDRQLFQGRLDAQYGVYRQPEFLSTVYDQGFREGLRGVGLPEFVQRLEDQQPNPAGLYMLGEVPGRAMAPAPKPVRRMRRMARRMRSALTGTYRTTGIF